MSMAISYTAYSRGSDWFALSGGLHRPSAGAGADGWWTD
jgi:hypothetical protein